MSAVKSVVQPCGDSVGADVPLKGVMTAADATAAGVAVDAVLADCGAVTGVVHALARISARPKRARTANCICARYYESVVIHTVAGRTILRAVALSFAPSHASLLEGVPLHVSSFDRPHGLCRCAPRLGWTGKRTARADTRCRSDTDALA